MITYTRAYTLYKQANQPIAIDQNSIPKMRIRNGGHRIQINKGVNGKPVSTPLTRQQYKYRQGALKQNPQLRDHMYPDVINTHLNFQPMDDAVQAIRTSQAMQSSRNPQVQKALIQTGRAREQAKMKGKPTDTQSLIKQYPQLKNSVDDLYSAPTQDYQTYWEQAPKMVQQTGQPSMPSYQQQLTGQLPIQTA